VLITDIWAQQPGKFFCISTKDGGDKWKDHFFTPDEFGQIRKFLRDHDDCNIYFCPHGFNRRVRQKSEAVIPNLLWADLDFADPKGMKPKPTVAIESSPGRFVGLWVLKEPMTEELNRRLTYHLDADHGGWDLTQVLRFPGTKNYKYTSQPKVRTLWDDGPKYSIKKLEVYLPAADPEQDVEHLSAAEVFEQYQGKLPRWVRRELLAKKITGRADRSEMLWKLENACVEAGMTVPEAFAVIKGSAWNKFAGRRNEEEQLTRELAKVVENQFREKPKGADKRHRKSDEEESREEKRPHGFIKFESMDQVKQEELDFVWRPYLARGEVSILEGDPGLGKSYLAQMVGASIVEGRRLLSPYKGAPKVTGPVVYFDMENSAGTVTKPRLTQNGFSKLSDYHVVQQPFSIDDEDALDFIYEQLEMIKPALVVFDTLNTYIGRADTHKASEVAQAFGIFIQIAKHFNCSVLVLRHLTKGAGSAMYRGQGSITFAGLARVVMSVGVDPNDTETKAMAITKMNFAKAPQALTFRIEERKKGASEFVWGEFVNLSSQEIMDAASTAREEGKQGNHMQDAMEFLESMITDKALPTDKLYRMAEKRSINRKMLERAAGKMDIVVKTKGKGKDRTETWKIKGDKTE
jgi:archaellum biogenesis ATPase FlaH